MEQIIVIKGLDLSKTVAFVGHETAKMVYGPTEADILLATRLATYDQITQLIEQGYDTFVSGMSDGFEMMAAEAVLLLRRQHKNIRLICVQPHCGQCDSHSPYVREIYAKTLHAADQSVTLSKRNFDGIYNVRNDFMLKTCSLLVCFYSGFDDHTRRAMELAREMGMPVINIYDTVAQRLAQE